MMISGKSLRDLLAHPATRGLDIDDPRTTDQRREIIQGNSFLRRIYEDWYQAIARHIPDGPGHVLELGPGAGWLNKHVPNLIASEIFACSGVQAVLDARYLPFAPASLKAITMIDVLHHVPNVESFFVEAKTCLRDGGSIVMIEPWVSTWSRPIYKHLHHEPFDPEARDWTFPTTGPLSGANGALPWIIFDRDRKDFEARYPDFEIRTVGPFMPFRYLVSGGVSMRQLMPAASYFAWRGIDSLLSAWPNRWAMFAFIHLTKRAPTVN